MECKGSYRKRREMNEHKDKQIEREKDRGKGTTLHRSFGTLCNTTVSSRTAATDTKIAFHSDVASWTHGV